MKVLKSIIIFVICYLILTTVNIMLLRGNYDWEFASFEAEDYKNITVTAQPEDVIKVTDIRYDEDYSITYVNLKPLKKGETTLTIHIPGKEVDGYESKFIVDPFMVIREKDYTGSMDNMGFIRFEILALFILMFANSVYCIRRIKRRNKYSYGVMFHLGAALFAGENVIVWIVEILTNQRGDSSRLYSLYGDILSVFAKFSLLAFPFTLVLAIFLVISNIFLIKKEGKSFTNTLGIILGLFLVGMMVSGLSIYGILQKIIDVYSYKGYHISLFVESIIYSVLAYFECMMVSTAICTIKAQDYVPSLDKDYVIILGCSIRKDGTPTPLLAGRADRAIWFANKQKKNSGKDIIYVASGGQGSDEVISEAQSIRNYLVEKGVEQDKIIMEDKSTTTNENMRFSKELIHEKDANAKVAFSTTGYHVFRSGNIAYRVGLRADGIGSKTKWYFYVNALIREFIANLNVARRKHILNVIAIILTIGALLVFSYRFNIL